MGAIVLLSLCCALSKGALTHIWNPNFVAAAQGIPLDLLALVARGACVPGSHRTVTIGERVLGRVPSPGHRADLRLKHTPVLSLKEAYLLVLELWPKGQGRLQVWHTSGPTEVLSGDVGWDTPSLCSPSALL